jgi:acyl-CoA synthetase (AMP-forming)/AMP-acid ligase II
MRNMGENERALSRYNFQPFGYRLLPQIIDERANAHHERPFAAIPKTQNIEDGFTNISYWTLANAINRCAQWLVQCLGRPQSTEVIAYLATPDLRYQILAMAASKVAYVVCKLRMENLPSWFSHELDVLSVASQHNGRICFLIRSCQGLQGHLHVAAFTCCEDDP